MTVTITYASITNTVSNVLKKYTKRAVNVKSCFQRYHQVLCCVTVDKLKV